MIRSIIWDLDGTLFDTYPAVIDAFDLALKEYGVNVPRERLTSLARKNFCHCIAELTQDNGLHVEELITSYRKKYDSISLQSQPLFSGAVEICEYIQSINGLNVLVTHRGKQSADRLFKAYDIHKYFADCITGDDGFPHKPDPASFEEMITRYTLRREETLAIGDRDLDILAGKAAGVRTCAFGPGPFTHQADYSITAYPDLLHIIRAENH